MKVINTYIRFVNGWEGYKYYECESGVWYAEKIAVVRGQSTLFYEITGDALLKIKDELGL